MAPRTLYRLGVATVTAATLMTAVVAPGQYNNSNESGRVAAVSRARGELNRSLTQLRASVAKVRSTWTSNADYIKALDAVTAARKDFDAAQRGVVDKLKESDPTYAALLKTQGEAAGKVREEQRKINEKTPATTRPADSDQSVQNVPAPSPGVMAAAQEKLDNKAKLRNIEDKAVAADPDAKKAQDKLNEAQSAVKVWQAQLDAALKTDPDFTAAQQQVATARSQLVSAGSVENYGYDNYGDPVYVR